MTRSIQRTLRTVAAAAMTVLVATVAGTGHAFAEEELRLRSNITVTDKIVRVGDLFENAGAAAEMPIFRAPSPGRSGFLTATRISYAVRNYGLKWQNRFRLSEIAVYRDGRQIPLSDIEDAIKLRITQLDASKQASDLELTFDRTPPPLVVPSDAVDDIAILNANFEPRTGRFVVVITTSGKTAGPTRRKYTGKAVDVVSIPVLTRSIARGGRISRDDVVQTRMPRSTVPANALFDASDVIGMVTKRSLRAGAFMRIRDLERPRIVRKSELVTVVYTAPGIQLVTKAQAMESGGKGDLVTIMNPRSRRVFQAVVTGPNMVSAALAAPQRVASNRQ